MRIASILLAAALAPGRAADSSGGILLGFTVEHWTDSDLLTADTPGGVYGLFDPINQWGPAPPADLDF